MANQAKPTGVYCSSGWSELVHDNGKIFYKDNRSVCYSGACFSGQSHIEIEPGSLCVDKENLYLSFKRAGSEKEETYEISKQKNVHWEGYSHTVNVKM